MYLCIICFWWKWHICDGIQGMAHRTHFFPSDTIAFIFRHLLSNSFTQFMNDCLFSREISFHNRFFFNSWLLNTIIPKKSLCHLLPKYVVSIINTVSIGRISFFKFLPYQLHVVLCLFIYCIFWLIVYRSVFILNILDISFHYLLFSSFLEIHVNMYYICIFGFITWFNTSWYDMNCILDIFSCYTKRLVCKTNLYLWFLSILATQNDHYANYNILFIVNNEKKL